MAHEPKVKTTVRKHYVFDRFTLEQSAQKAGVSFGTARRWKAEAEKAGDDWDKARDVQIMAGGEIADISQSLLTGFIVQYRSTMDELQNDPELNSKDKTVLLGALADSFAKMTSASKKILPEVSELATAMKTIELFGEFIQQNHPHLLSDFSEALGGFGAVLNQHFGKGK